MITHTGRPARTCHPVIDVIDDRIIVRDRTGRAYIRLTATEHDILHFLAFLPPDAFATYEDIADVLAGVLHPDEGTRLTNKVIRWHAYNLRQKLSNTTLYEPREVVAVPWPDDLIEIVRGQGLALKWSIKRVPSPAQF